MATVRTNVNRTLKHQMGDSVFHESLTRELGYSTHGKNVIKETPGLLSAFYKMSKEKIQYYEDPKGRFKIRMELPRAGCNTSVSYVITIGLKKYFVKEVNNDNTSKGSNFDFKYVRGRDGVTEHKAIELLKQQGVNVIPAHLSYVNPHPDVKKSFIVYDFSQLKTVEDLFKEDKITGIKLKNIRAKLDAIQEGINKNFHTFGLDKYYEIWDLDIDNAFYSLKENKFYVFDPILRKKR